MKAVDKKRINCDDLVTKIKECPSLKKIFGERYSETFMKFVAERDCTCIHECNK
jgi:hypothetical protein